MNENKKKMKVKDLQEKLEEAPDNSDVRIDPPYHRVLGAYIREGDEVVELTH